MTKTTFRAATTTVVLLCAGMSSAHAQDGRTQPTNQFGAQTVPAPAPAAGVIAAPAPGQAPAALVPAGPGIAPPAAPGAAFAQIAPGYPYLNAPMYTCPRQDVPYQMGGVFITNQALYPQEMLYPHEYKAMYPPFYYRAHGGWIVTPFGVQSHESWQLQGTVVKVKYRPRYSLFSAFHPPVIR